MSSKVTLQARRVYKELHYLARDYPDPTYDIHGRLRACFGRYVDKSDDEKRKGIERAEFIKKELLALYSLKKYRSMKNSYYD